MGPGCLGHEVVMVGHSQGGQATLFAEKLAASYGMGPGMHLAGAVAWAPALGAGFTRRDAIPADTPTAGRSAFYAMYLYGMARYYGAPPDPAWLTPEAQKVLPELLESECVGQLFTDLPARFPKVGTLYTSSFLANPGADPWGKYGAADVPGDFHTEAPTLIVQGKEDNLVLPATVQCIVDRMTRKGDRVEVCAQSAGHGDVVQVSWHDILPWLVAAASGKAPPALPPGCAGPLPACPAR
jgi:pimeloyl-ACP methyl ester carboxylesterase